MKVTLTEREIYHLLNLLYDNQDSGEYYGRRDTWYKDTEILIKKLEKGENNA